MWDGYDSSLSQIVYPHLLYDASDYYLSDISMKHSLENEIHANPYEQGYSANSDEGLFFTEAFYDTKGRGLKKFNNEFEKDLFGYAIGAFDLTEGKGGFLVDLIVDLSDYGYYYDEIQSGGQPDETIIEFQPNRTNQIKKYEKLIKNLNITIKQPKEEKQIFGTGDSVKSTFEINCFDEGTLTRFINSIHLSVGVDNTVRYLGQMYGTYDILCTEESFYSTSKDKEASFNNVYSDTLEYKGDAVFYKYVANYTGKHIFETTGNTDTYIELYKFNNGYLDKNDDGGNERNARLQFHLIKGEIYYIKVMGYNDSKVGDFNFIIMYDKYSAINATVNSNYYFTIDEVDECIIIAFTPPYSDSYIFETTGSTDTYMCLLDPNFNQYTFDDNSGSLNNAKIQYSLISGRTFYILIKCSSNSTGSFTFKITES
jgi:hypothetical protein